MPMDNGALAMIWRDMGKLVAVDVKHLDKQPERPNGHWRP